MGSAVSAVEWLKRASATLERHPELVHLARRVRGFRGGGAWMVAALSAVRDRRVAPRATGFRGLGIRKYAACLAAGCGAASVASTMGTTGTALAIGLGVLAFYVVEARHVFDFAAAIDFGPHAGVASRALRRRAGGTPTILTRILPIAAFMVFAWLVNGRPRRNFAIGCTAVLLWYESVRRREDATPSVLELATSARLSIRRVGDRDAGADAIRVMYASDLHLGAFGASRAMRDLQRATVRERPDVVLLGGDLIDRAGALPELREWTRRLARWAEVAAVPGNHDSRWLARVKSMVIEAGGHWLPDAPLRLRGLRIDGSPVRASRAERRLLCAHHPGVFESAAALGYDFVMAGHLHGGQMILFDARGLHYPGAMHSRWTGPEFAIANATMWVSRGLADTLPIRFRCPREVLIATLRGESSGKPAARAADGAFGLRGSCVRR